MITEGLQAFILHKRCSGETSAQITFFTREKGVVSARWTGGRLPKKQSLLQAFTSVWLTFDLRNDWHYVRQLDVIAPSLMLSGDALFAGLYINEILYHGLRPLDPCPALYAAYEQTLMALPSITHRLEMEAALRRFEWQFLTASGYPFSLTHEALTSRPVLHDKYYNFIAGEGFVLADQGILGVCILAMSEDNLGDPSVLKAAKWIMRRAIDHALDGKRIRARELYQ